MAMLRVNQSPLCKICYTDAGTGEEDRLIESPCRCRGSMGWVHLDCLTKWLNASASTFCEVCSQHYKFKTYRRPVTFLRTKFVLMFLTVLSLNLGPAKKLWAVGSAVDDFLCFVFKILAASLFVDWVFIKLGVQSKSEHIVVLDVKK